MDNYIDNEETQKYGPALVHHLERAFRDSPAEAQATVAYAIGLLKAANARMHHALHAARKSREALSGAAESKGPALEAARNLLSAFGSHLDSKQKLGAWTGDIRVFLPGGMTGVGKSGTSVRAALATALGALEKDSTVPEHGEFLRLFRKAAKELESEAGAVSDAAHAARSTLSEQSEEKLAWLRAYRGVALLVEGLLTLEGRASELAAIVPHLSVNGGATDEGAPPADPTPSTPRTP